MVPAQAAHAQAEANRSGREGKEREPNMIAFAGAVFLAVSFIVLIKIFGLVEKSTDVVHVTKLAFADLRNPDLDEEVKELALQRHAKQLFTLFFLLTLGSAASLALPMGLIWLLEQIRVLSLTAVMTTLLSWEFLLASAVVAALFWITGMH
jgi:hypothetical protein